MANSAPKKNYNNKGGGTKNKFEMTTLDKNCNKFSPFFWIEMIKMIKSKNKNDKKFAMVEFNKIQIKRMPTKVSGDEDNPIQVGVIMLPNKNGSKDKLATDTKTK